MSNSDVFFGVEIGGTKLQSIGVAGDGRLLRQCRAKVRLAEGAAGIRTTLLAELTVLRKEFQPTAIGVGFGGPVDWRTGVVVQSFQVEGWNGFRLAEWLSAEMDGLPVYVENDAKAAAYAEAMYGAGRGHRLVFYSNSGSGVGAGLVIDGELYRGGAPGELELGHVRLDLSGRTVEEAASGWSIDRRVRQLALEHPACRVAGLVSSERTAGGEAELLSVALADGDLSAHVILTDTARDYAHGLSHAVHLLHPEIIVLGGGVSLLGEPWRATVAEQLSGFLMEAFRPGPPVVLAELGEIVVPLGAAMLAKRRSRALDLSRPPATTLEQWMAAYIAAQHLALDSVKPNELVKLVKLLAAANRQNRRVFVCGNGGNAANASHFATDLGKNASAAAPHPFHVLSLNDNMSWMTAIGNDYSYDEVFVRQLQNHAQAGDVLIVSSVSGNSPNLLRALEWAREKGLATVALVGANRSRAAELAEHAVVIDDQHYGRVEDVQMHIFHLLCYAFVEKVAPKT